ncbi:MAG: preprotein translocase subunit SecG [Candidatus Hydrothermae bacterium]|nr:preprotein translocase subunit SecG [Candidatus Hydrothermae bacterium]
MFFGLLLFIYLIVVILMIGAILVQKPRGGGLSGALGGGGMENILGARGAPTFFTKLTAFLGGFFLVLSLVLSILNAPRGYTAQKSAIERTQQQGQPTPLNLPPVGGGSSEGGQGEAPQGSNQ